MDKKFTFTVKEGDGGRVDKLSSLYGLQRSFFSSPDTRIFINGKECRKSAKCKQGDAVEILYKLEMFTNVIPQNIPLDVLYEDDEILVINKPSGLVVHPALGNYDNTLVNALLYRYGESFNTQDDDVIRPGIVHRLDKDTSGVMVIAKTAASHKVLSGQFKAHTAEKYYIAFVKGSFIIMRDKIDKRIARSLKDRKLFDVTESENRGKTAVTNYEVLQNFENYALVKVRIDTGRTHQIRVHMKSINHPILGDELYSRKDDRFKDIRLMLHSLSLEIKHPVTGERMKFVAPLPSVFSQVIKELHQNQGYRG